MTHFRVTLVVFAAAFVAACASAPSRDNAGDSTSSTGGAPAPGASVGATPVAPPAPASTGAQPGAPSTGVLLFAAGAPVVGLPYSHGSATGTTDAAGTFTYAAGEEVRFSYGGAVLGKAAGAPVLSPYALAGASSCDDGPAVGPLVAALEALDTDADPTNGITIPSTPPATPKAIDPTLALHVFVRAFDGEAWHALGTDSFAATDAIVRGQGVANDGTSWFFSGTTGLDRTNASFASTTKNVLAIPVALALGGSDHIGDIDVWNGTLYAPIEDKKYEAPKVVLFDAASLDAGQVFDIPQSLQTKGVPWIAVDGPRGVAYMAEWDPTPELHVFDLATMAYQHAIPLVTATGTPIGRIQGGKVYKGALYLSSDDAAKTIYKVHLATGTVIQLFALNEDMELEGLSFGARPDGSLLHTLDVPASRTSSELRHHQITKEPLRWKVCP
jgi:hypothetical protein